MKNREVILRMLQHALQLAVISVLWFVACTGRDDGNMSAPASDAGDGDSPAMDVARTLAASVPEIATRLEPTDRGFTLRDGLVRSSAVGPAALRTHLPERAGGAIRFAVGGAESLRTEWRLEDARDAALELDRGRAIYRDALPSVDAFVTTDDMWAELSFVLRDASAPTTFQWRVDVPEALSRVEQEESGAIVFLDQRGRARLRVGRAIAVDAAGVQRDAELGWSDGALTLSVDTSGLAYPVLVDPLVETVTWQFVNNGVTPNRSYAAMAFDSGRGVTVLFGGNAGGTSLSDTWEWNGTSWTQRFPATIPPQRYLASAAYDETRGVVVLFGGRFDNTTYLNDTWEWNGTDWTPRTSGTTPPSIRYGAAMAYHALRGRVVLFGGDNPTTGLVADTWEWDGSDWNDTSAGGPSKRYTHAMAYDSTRGRVVLFGGWGEPEVGQPSTYLSDTWEYDTTGWSPVATGVPAGRQNTGLAYDIWRRKLVLWGGSTALGVSNETWEWDGITWQNRTPQTPPSAAFGHSMVFDSVRSEVVMVNTVMNTYRYYGVDGTCTFDSQCSSGFCADGVCCDTACGGGDPSDCYACSISAGAPDDGTCAPRINGSPCDDGSACTTQHACNAGVCESGCTVRVFQTSSTFTGNLGGVQGADAACQAAADAALLGGTWRAWVSTAAGGPAASFPHAAVPYVRLDGVQLATSWADLADNDVAAPINVDENLTVRSPENVWTGTNVSGTPYPENCLDWTSAAPIEQGVVGSNTGTFGYWTDFGLSNCDLPRSLYCFETGALTCSNISCDDNNPCTTDTCDIELGCAHTNVLDGTGCPDSDACNGYESCQSGICSPGTALECDDGDPCTFDECLAGDGCQNAYLGDGASCADILFCNGEETCQFGSCTSGTPPCDDNIPCTSDTCSEASGCQHTAQNNLCDDGNACTDETCVPATGCTYVPNTNPCDDGNTCTQSDLCVGGACMPGTPRDLDGDTYVDLACGGTDCNDNAFAVHPGAPEICDGIDNNCVSGIDEGGVCLGGLGTPCSSGAQCGSTLCVDGVCCNDPCGGGTPTDCQACNGASPGTCSPLTGNPCDDGNTCTTTDTCNAGVCTGTPKDVDGDTFVDLACGGTDCNDVMPFINPGATEVCDGVDNNCVSGIDEGGVCLGALGAPCSSGTECASTFCADGVCCNDACGGGVATDCQACNIGSPGTCAPLTGDPCDDGLFCNGPDVCSSGVCIQTGDPCPGPDGDADCAETCDEASDTCTALDFEGAPCDDALSCTTGDVCTAGTCAGLAPDLDGDTFTDAACGGTDCNDGSSAIYPGAPESCDGCDQDCDAIADNGAPSQACGLPNPPNCAGTQACVSSVVAVAGTCNGGAQYSACSNTPSAEVCDSVDNDCNGLVDDNVTGVGLPCGAGTIPPCQQGVSTCVGGTMQCVGNVDPSVEICDGIDNDCNGVTDDALTDVPAPLGCWTLPGSTCSGGGITWAAPPGATCTGVGTLTAPCNAGTLSCTGASGWQCTGGVVPVAEACDNADNDCDGVADDGNPGGGGSCGTDVGECQIGTLNCVGGTFDCVGDVGPVTETCDGLDNDCDTVPDNGVSCGLPLGSLCSVGTDCGSGNCVDGRCCDTACGGGDPTDCQACSIGAGGTVDGTCGVIGAGTVCRAVAGVCDVAEQCDGAGTLCPTDTFATPDVGCRASAGECDLAENCTGTGALCPPDDVLGAGNPCSDDGNPCTSDTCDGVASTCPHTALANNTPCDDTNYCTDGDVCAGGACVGGPLLSCDDGNSCTDDSCDSVLGCQNVDNTAACDDGNACTTGEVCTNGTCQLGSPVNCDDGNLCTDDTCDSISGCQNVANTAPCDDGNTCTQSDACSGGACLPGTPANCDDGNPCTDEVCDLILGCQNVANTAPCNDGNACTVTDTCSGGVCTGSPLTCDDLNSCTDDYCDSGLGGCQFVANVAPCDDGNACTELDACSAGACQPGTPVVCDDGNPCTDEVCDLILGCQNPNNNAPCDDGNACTLTDVCTAGGCVGVGTPTCDDGNGCTDDYCDIALGCQSADNVAPCDDGNACTQGDTCALGACVSGGPLDCDDFNECTVDTCDGITGCVNAAATDGTPCTDDGNLCTNDTCQGGFCNTPVPGGIVECQAPSCSGTEPNAIATLQEFCDGAGTCPSSAPVGCGQSVPCNTAQTACQGGCAVDADCPGGYFCSAGSCTSVQLAGQPCSRSAMCETGFCADGVCCDTACTGPVGDCQSCALPGLAGTCSPATGTACSDGSACTTGDTCTAGTCAGTPVVCDDGNACTADTCLPGAGCQNAPVTNGTPCNDGSVCTTVDTCQSGVCSGTTPVVCNDGDPCTTDSCDPVGGCQTAPATDGTACTDGDACTSGDTCLAGICQGSTAVTCSDGNPCTDDTCAPATGCVFPNNTLPCSDGSICTTGETCSGGACVGGTAVNCDDGNACTVDACSALAGCTSTVLNGTACSDGDACTGGDTCVAGTCLGQGPTVCDDANPCTTDTCDTAQGGCVFTTNTLPCNDGNACTTGDVCQGGACAGGTMLVCNDGNACTTDSCDPGLGCVRTNVVDDTPCAADGNVCTFDVCKGGQCNTAVPAGTVVCAAASCTTGTELTEALCDGAGSCPAQTPVPCAPGQCDPTGTFCEAGCATDADCLAAYFCDASGACVTDQALGQTCITSSQCASGFCADGVCCDSACTGTCQACSSALTGGTGGTCAPVRAGTDPDSNCSDQGPASCGTTGACDANGSCQLYGAGTACAPDYCSGGSVTESSCDGTGACVASEGATCGSFACKAGKCNTTCATNTDCAATATCLGGTCQPKKGSGETCTSPDECSSGSCADGVCCDRACGGLCEACSAAKKGSGANGVCGPIARGVDPDAECRSEDATTCGQTGFCDGAGACELHAQGTVCEGTICATGSAVRNEKTCDGVGHCLDRGTSLCEPYLCSGSACSDTCQSDADCVEGATCGGNGRCVVDPRLGVPCSSSADCDLGYCVDGLCCNEVCSGACQACSAPLKGGGLDGICGPVASGSDPAAECSQGSPESCGQDGSCDGAGACRLFDAGTICARALCVGPATESVPDACDGEGTCVESGARACNDGFACVGFQCRTQCSSDVDCTSTHHCVSGECIADSPVGAPCTASGHCQSNFCVDGVCCDRACQGECEACSAAKKSVGANGICEPVSAGTDPDEECPAGMDVCGAPGVCDGVGACREFALAQQACGTTSCVDGSVTGAICDGAGTCVQGETSCAPFLCAQTECGSGCASDADCSTDAFCTASGTCAPKRGNGESCELTTECTSGFCVDGFCCDVACDGQCEACDVASAPGTCSAVTGAPHGFRPSCAGVGTLCGGSCGGQERTACTFPGALLTCGDSVCDANAMTLFVCNGAGACSAGTRLECEPFACADGACRTSCSNDADCADGFACSAEGQCLAADAEIGCDTDEVTLVKPDGSRETCAPFRCRNDACLTSCTTDEDCAGSRRCENATCVIDTYEGEAFTTGTFAAEGSFGCAVSRRSSSSPLSPLGAPVALLLLAAWRRQRVTAAARGST